MVYLIHFSTHFHHAQHYIGFVEKGNLKRRMTHHRNGSGANLMKHVSNAGIDWQVARTWKDGDRDFERRLKKCKKPFRFCPICNPDKAMRNMTIEKLANDKNPRPVI